MIKNKEMKLCVLNMLNLDFTEYFLYELEGKNSNIPEETIKYNGIIGSASAADRFCRWPKGFFRNDKSPAVLGVQLFAMKRIR